MKEPLLPKHKPLVQLGSLDTFYFPHLQRGLAEAFATHYISTWSLKKSSPNPDLPTQNVIPLHYLLQLYKMLPWTHFENRTYHALCCAFDSWFMTQLKLDASALWYLSGCGLWTSRRFRRRTGRPILVDSGSTHTDWQHHIVLEEFKRNGIQTPLFPECYRKRVRTEFEEADWIQIPSRFVAQTYLKHGIPESKLLLAPYGADTSLFKPRTHLDVSDTFRIICPSGVNLRKGARVLAEAWRKLSWKDAELHWFGSPNPETEHLFKPHLSGIVWHHHMSLSELAAVYRSCDVLVLPSFEEGFARVLIEGAASGLPIIATPHTGVEELFTQDNPEGWLIPCNDVNALCDALIEAKADRQKTFALGQRAASKSRQGYSWEDYGERVRANLKKILS